MVRQQRVSDHASCGCRFNQHAQGCFKFDTSVGRFGLFELLPEPVRCFGLLWTLVCSALPSMSFWRPRYSTPGQSPNSRRRARAPTWDGSEPTGRGVFCLEGVMICGKTIRLKSGMWVHDEQIWFCLCLLCGGSHLLFTIPYSKSRHPRMN